MWQAVLFDLTASSLWEAGIESQEVFSINDTIVTGIGGISLGESAFQLGELFARSAPTWRNRLLLTLFSPARAFLALTEGAPLPQAHSVDSHGIADDVYHRFVLSAGGSFAATPAMGTAARRRRRGAVRRAASPRIWTWRSSTCARTAARERRSETSRAARRRRSRSATKARPSGSTS